MKTATRLAGDLRRTANGIDRAEGRFLSDFGLTVPQWAVLAALGRDGPQTMASIVLKADITKGTLTGVVARMREKGWLVERDNENDGRSRIIQLSAEGQRLYAGITPDHDRLLRDLLAPLGRGEIRPVRRSLRRIQRRLRNR